MSFADSTAGFAPVSVLTRSELLDHAKHPRNYQKLADADASQTEVNPLCGDEVTVYLRTSGEAVIQITFTGKGCLISQAAASLLSEFTVGKSAADILRMELSDMEALIGGAVSPSRAKCAMLALVAIKNGIQQHVVRS